LKAPMLVDTTITIFTLQANGEASDYKMTYVKIITTLSRVLALKLDRQCRFGPVIYST